MVTCGEGIDSCPCIITLDFHTNPYAWLKSKTLNALSLGDSVAKRTWCFCSKERLLLLATAVGLSCTSVSMAGGIGFIGLVAPHIARKLVGTTYQHFLPLAGIIGMIILVLADTIGRSIFEPNSIPAGIVVATLGAPYFLCYLQNKINTSKRRTYEKKLTILFSMMCILVLATCGQTKANEEATKKRKK